MKITDLISFVTIKDSTCCEIKELRHGKIIALGDGIVIVKAVEDKGISDTLIEVDIANIKDVYCMECSIQEVNDD